MTISIRRARLPDYLFIRRVRNENRRMMTGNQKYLTLWDQLKFWWKKPSNMHLYVARIDRKRAGYLLLHTVGGLTYITEVVSAEYRREGIGAAMISFAQVKHQKLLAEIWEFNQQSVNLHIRSGFRLHGESPYPPIQYIYVWP